MGQNLKMLNPPQSSPTYLPIPKNKLGGALFQMFEKRC